MGDAVSQAMLVQQRKWGDKLLDFDKNCPI